MLLMATLPMDKCWFGLTAFGTFCSLMLNQYEYQRRKGWKRGFVRVRSRGTTLYSLGQMRKILASPIEAWRGEGMPRYAAKTICTLCLTLRCPVHDCSAVNTILNDKTLIFLRNLLDFLQMSGAEFPFYDALHTELVQCFWLSTYQL